ncbi:MAG TPA: aminotransferase class IV, partial [Thermoanaerobaculia bacterium]|nr:aminotransferase class IV [Thermoanaerobaculia bacterium]
VLPGIVREWLLARANDLGYTIEPRAPTVDELREGAFFTGSLTELAPLRVLDGASCRPPGEAFGELLQAWRAERDAR